MKEYKAFYDKYQETKVFPEMPAIVNNLPVVKEENQNPGGGAQEQGPQVASAERNEKDKNQNGQKKPNEAPVEGDKKVEEKKEEEKK